MDDLQGGREVSALRAANDWREKRKMFDYFGVLVSVIFGLALTHLLGGVAKTIQMRHEVKAYWVHIVWTLNVVIIVLAIWWGMFWWKNLEDWTVEWFFFITGYAIAVFMWASMLFPPEFSSGLDCEEYFFANKSWFFGIGLIVFLMDIPETLQKQVAHLRDVPRQYVLFIPTVLIISVIGLRSSNRRIQGGLCVAFLLATLSYLFFTSLQRISQH